LSRYLSSLILLGYFLMLGTTPVTAKHLLPDAHGTSPFTIQNSPFSCGPNDYNYVKQNPWSAWDPLGLSTENPNTESDVGYSNPTNTPETGGSYSFHIPIEQRIANEYDKIARQKAYADELGWGASGYAGVRRRKLLASIQESYFTIRVLEGALEAGRQGEESARKQIENEQAKAAEDYVMFGGLYFTKPWSEAGKETFEGYGTGLADGIAKSGNNALRGTVWLGGFFYEVQLPDSIPLPSLTEWIDQNWTQDYRPYAQYIDPNIEKNPHYSGGAFMGDGTAELAMFLLPYTKLGKTDDAGRFLSKVPTKGRTPAETRGGTYLLRDTEGNVARTGRSKDLLRRRTEHARDPVLADLDFEAVHRTNVYREQRGLEQLLHDIYQPPLNKVRPISPKNPKLQEYLDAARNFLKK
jgi:hypothetical protein